jgi:hypothetical protein
MQQCREQTLTVRTAEDDDIDCRFGALDELTHAYAVGVHCSQGIIRVRSVCIRGGTCALSTRLVLDVST